jgi:hypothetical protein
MSHRANVRPKGWFLSRACIGYFNMVVHAGRASVPPEPSNHRLNLWHHVLMIGARAFAASATGGSAVAAEFYVVGDNHQEMHGSGYKAGHDQRHHLDNGTFKTRTMSEKCCKPDTTGKSRQVVKTQNQKYFALP